MKTFWMIIAIACVVVAIVYLVRANMEVAFVMAAISAVAWFLNYRVRAKKLITDETEQQKDEEYFDLDEQH